jgi:hypothetical protein
MEGETTSGAADCASKGWAQQINIMAANSVFIKVWF